VRWLAALSLLLATVPGAALADTQRVSLLLPGCELPGVSSEELRQAVALELQPDGLMLAAAGELSPERDVLLQVEGACPNPDELTLRAQRTGTRLSRTFRLSELAIEQRPRALSLSLSELASLVLHAPAPDSTSEPVPVEPRDEEPPAAPELPAPSTDAVSAPPARKPAAERARPARAVSAERAPPPTNQAARLALAPELRWFAHSTLWGARVALERERFRYHAGLLLGASHAAAGSVWTQLVHAGAAYAFPVLGAAEGSRLETGPRLGLGYTFMSAQASAHAQGFDARDWYADAAWAVGYRATISRSVGLRLCAELGYGRGPIGYADDVVIAQTSGPFASLSLEGSLQL
jgi:hypothetical protein